MKPQIKRGFTVPGEKIGIYVYIVVFHCAPGRYRTEHGEQCGAYFAVVYRRCSRVFFRAAYIQLKIFDNKRPEQAAEKCSEIGENALDNFNESVNALRFLQKL